jgi:hypothetical protein
MMYFDSIQVLSQSARRDILIANSPLFAGRELPDLVLLLCALFW